MDGRRVCYKPRVHDIRNTHSYNRSGFDNPIMDHTPQEIAQLKLRMHEATILQRDGQASHYITPVAHAVVTELTSTLGKRQHPVDDAHC